MILSKSNVEDVALDGFEELGYAVLFSHKLHAGGENSRDGEASTLLAEGAKNRQKRRDSKARDRESSKSRHYPDTNAIFA
jgi:hypothetical protein